MCRSPYVRRRVCAAIALTLGCPLWVNAQSQDNSSQPGPTSSTDSKAQQKPASNAGQSGNAQRPASGSSAPVQLGTVIVTANKREERLQDVPMAVSVVSDTQLERENATSFTDYASQVPGLNIISSGEGWTQLVLRGITSGSRQPNATVGTYIDDTPYGSSTVYAAGSMLTPDIDPNDLERIEVLRGPQGTLYGSNTLGGLVKFVTAPPDTTQASARVGVDTSSIAGGGSGYGTHATVNIPLIANTLALRVNVYDRDDPGYIRNITTGQSDIDKAKVSGSRAQLLWTPNDKVSVRFSALAQNLRSDGLANQGIDINPATLQPIYGWPNQARAAGTGMFKIKYRLYDLSVNADFGWAKLVSTTSYGTLRFNENTDITDLYGPVLNPIFGLTNGGYSEYQPIALNKVTQELRLQSPADQTWEWRAGAFFTHEHTTDNQDILSFNYNTGVPIALPTLGNVVVGPATFSEWAGYGDLTWHATSQLSIMVGARYSSDSTSYTQTTTGLLTGTTDFTTRGHDHPVTYLFNPSYKFSDDLMAYVRVASGFRPGGPNVGVPPGLGAPLTFGPDRLVNYELGLKSLMLDKHMSVEADVFYIDWSKVQLTTTAGGFSFLGNGGRATSKGAEVSWRYTPLAGLTLWANTTYTKAELAANTPPGGVYGLNGDPLPYVPTWNANLGADYDFPLGGGWSGFVGGNISYIGARYADFNTVPAPRFRLPSYNNVDMHVGVNYDNWTVELYAKNLANKRGITSMWPETLSSIASPFQATYQTPRTIGMSATVDF
ncbi:TonB-dependent receptor [Dyella caseinilytica]|uniref:TonB-dependent receptor n=1 Tax=Dyella caseinilytica TaxID=1849581 RepID=A0ABX7GZF2_9GAMM|nr:TonB-dependent receptor [Dyella caseinilytica]QRN55336.1 TonB-dependent receptor [Dyella caseinilytica]